MARRDIERNKTVPAKTPMKTIGVGRIPRRTNPDPPPSFASDFEGNPFCKAAVRGEYAREPARVVTGIGSLRIHRRTPS